MAGDVKLVYSISKNSYELIKKGLAQLSSGGVRSNEGEILELAKPAIKNVTKKIAKDATKEAAKAAVGSVINNISSPVAMVSSLVNNVQSAFIQKGVNQANLKLDDTLKKLDISLDKLDKLQSIVEALVKSNALSWVNCTFSLVNCGVSIAGICILSSKLNDVSSQILDFKEAFDNENYKTRYEEYKKYFGFIQSDIDMLQKNGLDTSIQSGVTEHINAICAFLEKIRKEYVASEFDHMFLSQIIFPLSVAYGQLIRFYVSNYYYRYNDFPQDCNRWLVPLLELISSDFIESYKKNLIIKSTDIHALDKIGVYTSTLYSVSNQLSLIEYEKELVQQIRYEDYKNIDHFVSEKLLKGDFIEYENYVCVELT